MNASTLTALREQQSRQSNGDYAFLLACKLGKNGPAPMWAYLAASMEAQQDRAPDTHHTDTRIADRVVELVSLSDPATGDTPEDRLVPVNEHWELVHVVAADDRDYAMWLFTAGTQFKDLCGIYPDADELAEPMWRQLYGSGTHPLVAAQITLHQRPMALVDAGRITCPVCRQPGEIMAEQVATRMSQVRIDDDGVYAEGRGGTSDLIHTRTWCHECGADVRLPAPIGAWT